MRIPGLLVGLLFAVAVGAGQVQDVIESQDGTVMALLVPALSDFRYGYARLNLWQEPEGTRILIRAEVEPDFWIPSLIGPWLIKRKLLSETLETVDRLEQLAKTAPVSHNTPPWNESGRALPGVSIQHAYYRRN